MVTVPTKYILIYCFPERVSEPPRIRKLQCPCTRCSGRERDWRTVQVHLDIQEELSRGYQHDHSSSDNSSDFNETMDFNMVNEASDGSDSESMDENVNSDLPQIPKERLELYLMNEAFVKLQRGHSESDIEQHLRNTILLLNESSLPCKWSEVLKKMKELGYRNPRHFKVCAAKGHSVLLKNKKDHPSCPFCGTLWENCIDYFVLGLHFNDWFLTEDACNKSMCHWDERDTWLNKPLDYQPATKSELWHGQRFRELSYFWDPFAETLLPEKCPECSSVITEETIANGEINHDSLSRKVTCKVCSTALFITPRVMKGDPRNQAIILHYDGWAPHSTSSAHSIAAITVTRACMNKLNRSEARNARVISFVPVHQLPRDSPHKYDAFFEPLLDEIEDLYIEGEECFFRSEIPGYSPASDIATLRVVPLLLTADSKGHAEISLTCAGGRKGCRRCQLVGEYFPEKRHYYYGHFQKRHRFPAASRTPGQSLECALQVDGASSDSQRKILAKEHGVTGVSCFYQLHSLCGFCPVKDLVVDFMHAFSLNLVRSELENHLLLDLGENASHPISERTPELGGLLSRSDLAKVLTKICWTTELRNGRIPSIPPTEPSGKHKLGNWKAEEFNKFIMIAPYVLHSIIPKPAYECFCTLTRIHQLVMSRPSVVEGWTSEHEVLLKQLLWRHAVLYENYYGTSACSENVEYSLHLTEDIVRHSTPDNYWCFLFERMVSIHKQQTTNMKQLCKTLANRCAQLQFVNTYLETHETPSSLPKMSFDLEEIARKPVMLHARSIENALALKEFLSTHVQNLPTVVQQHYDSGIVLGSSHEVVLSNRQVRDVQVWLERDQALQNTPQLPTVSQSFKRILKMDHTDYAVTYRTGEHVVLRDAQNENLEWVMKVTQFILYGPINDRYYMFVDGTYYAAKSAGRRIEYDEWTLQPKMIPKEYHSLVLQPTKFIKRKVMMYPSPSQPSCYLTIDPDRPVDTGPSAVPWYPLPGEIVEIEAITATKLVLVETVDDKNKAITGHPLKKNRGPPAYWVAQSNQIVVHFTSIHHAVEYRDNHGCYYLK